MYPLWPGGIYLLGHGFTEGALAGEMEEGGLILIAEYVEFKQKDVWLALVRRYLCFIVDWEAIMKERPLPGRAGILPEERGCCNVGL